MWKPQIGTGKNVKQLYYLRNFLSAYLLPNALFRLLCRPLLKSIDRRADRDYIYDRARYCCHPERPMSLADTNKGTVAGFSRKNVHAVYFFDSYRYLRWFPKHFLWNYRFGDCITIQPVPSITKSRPVGEGNGNNVLLNLNKVRHFTFIHDNLSFAQKDDRAIFRGEIALKPHRIAFCQRWFGSAICDVGEIPFRGECVNPAWRVEKISIYAHLRYKFIICLEGNDVASNLKWVMSSNSLAVMPRPKFETWFMEGRLVPNYHYVEIKPDYSDLEERMNYYIAHPAEAEAIIRHAHEWIAQFRHPHRERLISLLVLKRYFESTGQHL